MWILEAVDPEASSFLFRLPSGTTRTIGRAERADFIVDAPLVSRLHCRIDADEETLHVTDLSSTNGTYVNGRRVEREELKSGDRLRVGRIDFTISKSGSDV